MADNRYYGVVTEGSDAAVKLSEYLWDAAAFFNEGEDLSDDEATEVNVEKNRTLESRNYENIGFAAMLLHDYVEDGQGGYFDNQVTSIAYSVWSKIAYKWEQGMYWPKPEADEYGDVVPDEDEEDDVEIINTYDSEDDQPVRMVEECTEYRMIEELPYEGAEDSTPHVSLRKEIRTTYFDEDGEPLLGNTVSTDETPNKILDTNPDNDIFLSMAREQLVHSYCETEVQEIMKIIWRLGYRPANDGTI